MKQNQEHKNDFDQSFKKRFEEDAMQPPENAWSDLNAQFKEMDDEAFDGAIREKLNTEINPPEFLWPEVDKATQEKPRRIRGAYWIFLGCLLGGLGTYFLADIIHPEEEVTELSTSMVISEKDTENSNKINTEQEGKEVETANELIKENVFRENDTITAKNKSIKGFQIKQESDDYSRELSAAQKALKQPAKVILNSNLGERTSQSDLSETDKVGINEGPLKDGVDDNIGGAKDTLVENKRQKSTQFLNPDSSIQKVNIKEAFDGGDSASSKSQKDNLMSSLDSLSVNNVFDSDSVNVTSADTLIDSSLVATSDSTKVAHDDSDLDKEKLKNDSIKKWMVTAYAASERQYLRIISDTSATNHVFDSLYTSNKWLFELGVSYILKNQLQIGIGVSMNKFSYQYSKSAYGSEGELPIETSYPSGVVAVNALFGSTQTPDLREIQMAPEGADLSEFLFDKEILYNEKLDYTLVNIPLDVKWVPGNRRIKPVIKLGGEINILVNSSSEVSLTFLQETATVQNHAQLKALNFSGSFGVGTQIDLVKGLGITFLPSLNYQSGAIYTDSEYQFTPYSIRVYSGLYYKF